MKCFIYGLTLVCIAVCLSVTSPLPAATLDTVLAASFIKNPQEVMKANRLDLYTNVVKVVSSQLKNVTEEVMTWSQIKLEMSDKDIRFLEYVPTQALSAMILTDGAYSAQGVKDIVVTPGSGNLKINFLPYIDNGCTAMVLGRDANFFMTGPLSGCAVFVAEKTGSEPMVMHTNYNKDAAAAGNNMVQKDKMAINMIGTKAGYKMTRRLARGEYETPAFVYGIRGSDRTWKFYVYELTLKSGAFTIKSYNRELPASK